MDCDDSACFVCNRSPGDNKCMSDFRRNAVGRVMYGRLQIHLEKRLGMKKLLSVLLAFCLILLPACSSGSSKPDQTATAGTLTFTVPGEYRINEYDIITEVTTKKFTKEIISAKLYKIKNPWKTAVFQGFSFLPLLQKSVKVLKILFDSDTLVT